jgi:hypothetical protein
MNVGQIASLAFLIFGVIWMYNGLKMIYQSKAQDKQIIWYKRFKLTRGMYWLLLGVGLIIVESINVIGVQMPFGNVGSYIMLGLGILMVLFGLLSLRYKPQND